MSMMCMRWSLVALTLLVSGCGGDSDEARRGLLQADDAFGVESDVPVFVEGTLSIRDGKPLRMCRDANFGSPAVECTERATLVVRGADLDRVPRLSRVGAVRFAWPPVVLKGRLSAGVLEVTEMPPVYQVTVVKPRDQSVRLDQSGSGLDIKVTPGQRIGLVHEGWADFRSRTVSDGRARIRLEMLECQPSASCIAGYVSVGTDALAEGTFSFIEQGVTVMLRVHQEDYPGATTTR